jgi:hypothetical protein
MGGLTLPCCQVIGSLSNPVVLESEIPYPMAP